MRSFWKASAIIIAATIGEGMFALPYVFHESGWLIAVGYLIVLAAVVIAGHLLYFETLRRVGERERLLGLAKRYLGKPGFWVGFVAIVAGLLLALVAYLLIGPRFLVLAFPALPANIAFAIFWLAIALPVFIDNHRAAALEIVGAVLVVGIVLFVFSNGAASFSFVGLPLVNTGHAFLPFGVLLLALAGWTGIEPIYESTRAGGSRGLAAKKWARRGLIFGTILVATLYLLFATGITGAAAQITTDTISGIANWVAWKRFLLAALGLFAVGVGSVPLTHEIRNALEKDLGWNYLAACLTIILLPAALILAGLTNFVAVLGLAGGCFISMQYLLIIFVGRRALRLSSVQKTALDIVAIVFIVAAIYQIGTFIVR